MVSKIWTAEDVRRYGLETEPEVYSITNAQTPHSESVDSRFKAYAIKMALRIVCIIAAIYTHGWLMWVFIIGAGVLPWVAVVHANSNDKARNQDFSEYLSVDQRLALERSSSLPKEEPPPMSPHSSAPDTENKQPDIIDGEIVESPHVSRT